MNKKSFFKRLSSTMMAALVGVSLMAVPANAAAPSVQVKGAPGTPEAGNTFVSGLRITGLNKPQAGKDFDDEAIVMTDEGASWKIPVVWVDESGDVATRYNAGNEYLPTFAFYLPDGYAMQDEAYSVKLPDFVGDIYGEKETISVVNSSNGITYITSPDLAEIDNKGSYALLDVKAAGLSASYRNSYIARRNFDWVSLEWQNRWNLADRAWMNAQTPAYQRISAIQQLTAAQNSQNQTLAAIQSWINEQNKPQNQTLAAIQAWANAQGPQNQTAAAIQSWMNAQNPQNQTVAAIQTWVNAQNAQNQTAAAVQAWLDAQSNQNRIRPGNYPTNSGWGRPTDNRNISSIPNDWQFLYPDNWNIPSTPTNNEQQQPQPSDNRNIPSMPNDWQLLPPDNWNIPSIPTNNEQQQPQPTDNGNIPVIPENNGQQQPQPEGIDNTQPQPAGTDNTQPQPTEPTNTQPQPTEPTNTQPTGTDNTQPQPADTGNNQTQPATNGNNQQSAVDLVNVHCTKGAIDTIGTENLNNLVSLIRNVIEPQAVNLLTSKFTSFSTAVQKGELGTQIGLYIYNSDADSTSDPKNQKGPDAYVRYQGNEEYIEYFIGVDASTLYTKSENGTYVFKEDAVDTLSNTMTHEMMHAFMYDYTRSGMIGSDTNSYPDWFVEGIATTVGDGYNSQAWFYGLMTSGKSDGNSVTYEDIMSGYTDQEILKFVNGGIDSSAIGDPKLSASNSQVANYVTGYLACIYLGSMAAAQDNIEVTKTVDGKTTYDSDAIRAGLDKILTKLHEGTSLDTIIKDVSDNKYSGIKEFESMFLIANNDGSSYVATDKESLDFSLGYLNYLSDVSKNLSEGKTTTVSALGTVLLPFDTQERSPINKDQQAQAEVFKIQDTQAFVKSTVDPQTALASGGAYQTGNAAAANERGGMAAYVDNRLEIPGPFEGAEINDFAGMPDAQTLEMFAGYQNQVDIPQDVQREDYENFMAAIAQQGIVPAPEPGFGEMPEILPPEQVMNAFEENQQECGEEPTGNTDEPSADDAGDQGNGFDMLPEEAAPENEFVQDAEQ